MAGEHYRMHQLAIPGQVGPSAVPHVHLYVGVKLPSHPCNGTFFDDFWCPVAGRRGTVRQASVNVLWQPPCNVANRPNTGLDLDVPTLDSALKLSDAEQINLLHSAPKSANREEPFSVHPFVDKGFSKGGHTVIGGEF